MLVPLFGLQLLVTVYRPDPSFTSSQIYYDIATATVANSQVYSLLFNNFVNILLLFR